MSQETNFNVEIAKIVGEEVAKKALGSFTEEQLQEMVNKAVKTITAKQKVNPRDTWCDKYKDSQLDEKVSNTLFEKVKEKITERVASEEHQQAMDELAEQMMEEIIALSRQKMVEGIATRMANFSLGNAGPGQTNWEFDQYMRNFISNLPRPHY